MRGASIHTMSTGLFALDVIGDGGLFKFLLSHKIKEEKEMIRI